MSKYQSKSACISVQEYYYDLICPDGMREIPKEALEHIHQCKECHEEMDRLREVLASEGNDVQEALPQGPALPSILESHFSCLDHPVDCSTVKRFLPVLAVPALKVTIPTPITVHLEHCPACLRDFHALQNLHLTDAQLSRLSRLFAGESCQGDSRKSDEQIAAIAGQDDGRLIQSIMTRPNSGVVTRFSFNTASQEKPQSANDRSYSQSEYQVTVTTETGMPGQPAETPQTPHRKAAFASGKKTLVHILKSRNIQSAAAAVLVLFGMMFLFQIPAAKGVYLREIYQTLQEVRCLHLVRTSPAREKPLEEIWISKESNLVLIKNQAGVVLWNLPKKMRKVKTIGTNAIQTESLNQDQINNLNTYIRRSFDLMPFDGVSSMPDNASWNQMSMENTPDAIPGTTLYELTWYQQPGYVGTAHYFKWRCYLDLKTNIPQKTELYTSSDPNDGYVLISTITAQSISKETLDKAIQSLGF
jgi:hypothetical protein